MRFVGLFESPRFIRFQRFVVTFESPRWLKFLNRIQLLVSSIVQMFLRSEELVFPSHASVSRGPSMDLKKPAVKFAGSWKIRQRLWNQEPRCPFCHLGSRRDWRQLVWTCAWCGGSCWSFDRSKPRPLGAARKPRPEQASNQIALSRFSVHRKQMRRNHCNGRGWGNLFHAVRPLANDLTGDTELPFGLFLHKRWRCSSNMMRQTVHGKVHCGCGGQFVVGRVVGRECCAVAARPWGWYPFANLLCKALRPFAVTICRSIVIACLFIIWGFPGQQSL